MISKSDAVPLHVYVDVDDTLVRSAGSKRIPIPDVVRHVREMAEQGALLYCWSAGGADYARETAEALGIGACFMAFLPKPNVMIDDQRASDWPRCLHVLPSSCSGLTVDEYRSLIRWVPRRTSRSRERRDRVLAPFPRSWPGVPELKRSV